MPQTKKSEHGEGICPLEPRKGGVSQILNPAMARSRAYKKEIEDGVYGRDLIQPLNSDGSPNMDFVEHYGTREFSNEQREHIKDKYGGTFERREDRFR